MLDFADLIALNKFEKRGAEDALRDVRKQWRRNHAAFQLADDAGTRVPDDREPLQRSGRQPAVRGAVRAPRRDGGRRARWHVADPGPTELVERHALVPAAARALSRRDRGQRPARARRRRAPGCRGEPRPEPARGAASARRRRVARTRSSAIRPPRSPMTRPTPHRVRLRDAYNDALDAVGRRGRRRCCGSGRRQARVRHGRAVHLRGARPRDPRRQLHGDAESQPGAEARGAEVPGLGRAADVPAQGEPARAVSLHRGRLSVPARGGGPDAHVRGRRRSGAHQPPLPLRRGRARRGAALDRVRLDDAVRRGPGPAPRHLRAHRQLRRVDRDARRHEEALLGLRPLRADDVGVDDDQRSRADDPRDVHEHRDRPARRAAPARIGRLGGGRAPDRRRCYAGRERPRLQGRTAAEPRRLGARAARRHAATRLLDPRDLRAGSAPRRSRWCAARCRPTS